jgi:hypothetical protein
MKRIALSLILTLAIVGFVRADITTVITFGEYAQYIGNNATWGGNFPKDIGIHDSNGWNNDWYAPQTNVEYESGSGVLLHYSYGVSYGMSFWSGIALSTRTALASGEPYENGNDTVSVTTTGSNNSQTYAVAYGSANTSMDNSDVSLPYITLPDSVDLLGFNVVNTLNTDYALRNGYGVASALSSADDYFSLYIYGFDADGTEIGWKEVELGWVGADGVETLNEWKWVDLTNLTGAKTLRFAFDGSDVSGAWLNHPSYVAFDNLTYTFASDETYTVAFADTPNSTPEPATLLIVGLGIAGLGLYRTKKIH